MTEPSVYFSLAGQDFPVKYITASAAAFKHSVLGRILVQDKYLDGSPLERTENGAIILKKILGAEPEGLRLLIAQIEGSYPLHSASFNDVIRIYIKLREQLGIWEFPQTLLRLPDRLWTDYAWTDLTSWRLLTNTENTTLRETARAVQLAQGETPTPIDVFSKLSISEISEIQQASQIEQIRASKIVAGYQGPIGLKTATILLLEGNCAQVEEAPPQTNTATSPGGSLWSAPGGQTKNIDSVSHIYGATLQRTPVAGAAATVNNVLPEASTIVARVVAFLVDEDEALVYTLPTDTALCPPYRHGFPYSLKRLDKLQLWFHPQFGIEIKDSTMEKSRWRLSSASRPVDRLLGTPGTFSAGSSTTGSTSTTSSTPTMASTATSSVLPWLKNTSTPPSVPSSSWSCIHPQMEGSSLSFNLRWLKDWANGSESNMQPIVIMPWGFLVVHKRLDAAPAAWIVIEEQDFRQIYGERIAVHVKVDNSGSDDFAFTVSADLSRVYFLTGGQLCSQEIAPTTNKVEFEVSGAGNVKGSLSTSFRIDIHDGSPLRSKITCLGSLGRYYPVSGIYSQSRIQEELCDYFVQMSKNQLCQRTL